MNRKLLLRMSALGCVAAAALLALLTASFTTGSLSSFSDNPCPEGWYQDLSTDEGACRELLFDPSTFSPKFQSNLDRIHVSADRVLAGNRRVVGFDMERFDEAFRTAASNVIAVSTCSQESLVEALEEARAAGGGRVQLPACELALSTQVNIPGRTVLEGAGVSSTVLVMGTPIGANKSRQSNVLRIEGVENVVVRDLSIQRPEPSQSGDFGISLYRSDNILLERLRLSGVRVAFWAQHSSNFTVRYSGVTALAKAADETKPIKALSFGECDQAGGRTATTASCESGKGFQETAKIPTASGWTAGFAFYSNVISTVESWGSSSASIGEIAGNLYEFGSGQLKIDDGQFVLVHRNAFRAVSGSVVFRVATEVTDRKTRWLGFFENRIEDNANPGGYLLNFTSGDDLYLLNNHYRNNTGRIVMKPGAGTVESGDAFMCPNSEEVLQRNSSAFESISPRIRPLEPHNRLCDEDGGRYLFSD